MKTLISNLKIYLSGAAMFIGSTGLANPKIHCVSNAHFDSQWNWTVQTSISEYLSNTLQQNIWLLDHYPHYVFNFEGGVKYSWMKEYYPTEFERVKEFVRNGRWHISGASWDATDTNIPSPESALRNILLGQQFYKQEFGVKSRDIFLPDCFGFSYTLPSIAAHAGLIGFSTQKLQWRTHPFYGDSKVPFNIGLWKGVDGSAIMAVLNSGDYTRKFHGEPVTANRDIMELVENSPNRTAYIYYGTGDRGGSPTISSVESVTAASAADGPEVISSTSSQMFADYLPFSTHPELPTYDGELLMDVHGTGCYTSQAAMKALNRRNERLADAAERINVMADLLCNHPYPLTELNEEWRRFIWHQFHDDLTGTSIPEAYIFSWNDEYIAQNKFMDLIDGAASSISTRLDTRVKGIPVMVYNPVASTRRDKVKAVIGLDYTAASVRVFDPAGNEMPAQIDSIANGSAYLTFNADVPPLSVTVFDVRFSRTRPATHAGKALKANGNCIENSIYRVTVNEHGDISSIIDKRYGQELVDSRRGGFRLAMFEKNESYWWPAWEINKAVLDREPKDVTEHVAISSSCDGNAEAVLTVERCCGASRFTQRIRLTDGAADDRIDISNTIDWASGGTLLKAEFNTMPSAPKATYDLGLGQIARGNNTETAYEVPAQQWADLTDSNYGITVMTDSKYGWDKPADNTIRLTLLHTPVTGFEPIDYQNRQDFGRHEFTYSIRGHKAPLNSTRTAYAAECLNNPLIAYIVPKHAGSLGRHFSLLQTGDTDSSPLVKAVKMAEEGNGYVVRLYQASGNASDKATLSFGRDLLDASTMNGIEEPKDALATSGSSLSIDMPRYSISTLGVHMAKDAGASTAPQIQITLPHNHEAFSINHFWHEADFDGKGNTYAAELISDTIVSNGIRFGISRTPGRKHVTLCKGDTITLPPHKDADHLYILAAARDDNGSDVPLTIGIDGKTYKLNIPHYAGIYGQWKQTGFSETILRDTPLAHVGTHTHSAAKGDIPYEFTYIYRFKIDLPKNAVRLTLPDEQRIAIFAMTLAGADTDEAVRISDPRAYIAAGN